MANTYDVTTMWENMQDHINVGARADAFRCARFVLNYIDSGGELPVGLKGNDRDEARRLVGCLVCALGTEV